MSTFSNFFGGASWLGPDRQLTPRETGLVRCECGQAVEEHELDTCEEELFRCQETVCRSCSFRCSICEILSCHNCGNPDLGTCNGAECLSEAWRKQREAVREELAQARAQVLTITPQRTAGLVMGLLIGIGNALGIEEKR